MHAPDYGLAPEHPYPAGAEDVQRSALCGTRDTRHNASRWSVIPRAAGEELLGYPAWLATAANAYRPPVEAADPTA